MANSLKRPLRRDTASAYGAWGGISNYVDAACAAVHSIAVRPVSSTALSRRMCLGWLPRRRAILAAATAPHHPCDSCDLAPPFFPFPPLLSGCVRVPPCGRLSPALVAAYTLPLCLIHCTPVGSRLPPGFKTLTSVTMYGEALPCPRTVGQPVCVLPDRRMQFAPLSLPLLLAPPCGRPSWLRSV